MNYANYIPSVDQETFIDLSEQVSRLKMYPYFDIAHYIVTALYIRDDLGEKAIPFSRKHPFSLWSAYVLMAFAGSIIANLAIGKVPLEPFQDHQSVVLATIVWWLIFYFPFDVFTTLVKFLPIKCVIYVLKEVTRTKKVYMGVRLVYKLFPQSYLLMVIIGVCKGAGSSFVRPLERLIRGHWMPMNNEWLQPAFATKACILGSIVFILDLEGIIGAPHAVIYFLVVIFFVYFRLTALLMRIHDPLLPFENMCCALFMGGIWDAIQRAFSGGNGKGKDSGKANGLDSDKSKKE